jgi:hypothetical protein
MTELITGKEGIKRGRYIIIEQAQIDEIWPS